MARRGLMNHTKTPNFYKIVKRSISRRRNLHTKNHEGQRLRLLNN